MEGHSKECVYKKNALINEYYAENIFKCCVHIKVDLQSVLRTLKSLVRFFALFH